MKLQIKWLVFIFLIFVLDINAQSIDEYFINIPDVYFESLSKFNEKPFTKKTRKQIVEMDAASGFIDFQIERKNGYISFITNGDGENRGVELAIWNVGKDKLMVLCINVNANCTDYTKDVFVFKIRNLELIDISANILPNIRLDDFGYSKLLNKDIIKILNDQNIKWNWELPRIGKKIRIIAPSYDCGNDFLPLAEQHFEIIPQSIHDKFKVKIINHDEN